MTVAGLIHSLAWIPGSTMDSALLSLYSESPPSINIAGLDPDCLLFLFLKLLILRIDRMINIIYYLFYGAF